MVRSTHLARLRGGAFDVLVIGGGITGAGVVLEAAARGLSAALIERGDFAQGTSSWSTKLIHGGLRYLPMLDLAQVREGLEEQNFLLRNAPQLVRPLPFVLPLYRGATRPLGLRLPGPLRAALPLGLSLGLWTYDFLAGRRGGRRHRRLDTAAATALVPALRVDGLRRAFLYYDGLTDDARLTLTVLRTAAKRGAVVANYVEAVGVTAEAGRITGASLVDRRTGERFAVRAGMTINAAGLWAADVARLAGPPPLRLRRPQRAPGPPACGGAVGGGVLLDHRRQAHDLPADGRGRHQRGDRPGRRDAVAHADASAGRIRGAGHGPARPARPRARARAAAVRVPPFAPDVRHGNVRRARCRRRAPEARRAAQPGIPAHRRGGGGGRPGRNGARAGGRAAAADAAGAPASAPGDGDRRAGGGADGR